jgi:hypothetical protein
LVRQIKLISELDMALLDLGMGQVKFMPVASIAAVGGKFKYRGRWSVLVKQDYFQLEQKCC